MLCPVCKTVNLTMTERQGIEIDYCQECRGVWLDRGELDKIIDRSSQNAQAGIDHDRRNMNSGYDHHHDKYEQRKYDEHGYKKKRHGILGEIFDF